MVKKYKTVIILVNYNGFEDTEACIKSIADVNGELPFIIVVDNNSKDQASLKILHQIYDPLHIIMNDNNIGFGRANNVGIQWTQKNLEFEYLLLLNNDTLIEQNTIEQLIKPFLQDPKIGITTGKIMYEADRELVWYGGGDINYFKGWPLIADLNRQATPNGANMSRYISFASGCLMMFTWDSLVKLKGFNDNFFMYCEDLELSIRARKLNVKIYYESEAKIFHKVNASMSNRSNITGIKINNPNLDFQFYNKKVNQFYAMKIHLKTVDFLLFNIYFWFKYITQSILFILGGRVSFIKTSYKTLVKIIIT
ncbi:glycosyltransferase family 2 protein [uncultured Eudoraea sp.]|uniref:glycosyltransferase family 2 protein n=1 Tax=uncultured Eudoraea sp. TaxID=1035614 RepID=UPI00261F1EC3|nr:glycosyltransferase family 2 protein [uncultured Eudoraea sp.]